MKNVLVTGGAGFIGSSIVEGLLQRGDQVRILDNFSTGKRSNLSAFNGHVEIIEGDIREIEDLKRAVKDIELIFHEAALVSVPLSMQDPETCDLINVNGTVNVLSAAHQAGVQRVVMASSAAVYGDSEKIPLEEHTDLKSLSPYAASKLVNELYAKLFCDVFQLETVCLRYFNVYGPRQSPDSAYAAAIPLFINNLLENNQPTIFGDGGQARDFVFVEDVVEANLLATESTSAVGKIINICSGEEISILNLVEVLGRVLSLDVEPIFEAPRAGDIYRSVGNPELAYETLGFRARTRLEEGLMKTAAWMGSK